MNLKIQAPDVVAMFGEFFGSDISLDDLEGRTLAAIPKKLLTEESRLQTVKWFDYRRLHPMQAAYLCAHAYREAYRNVIRQCYDERKAPYVKGIREDDFMDNREHKALWRLRQYIDGHGMPYDFFLRHAMQWWVDRGFDRPPRLGHIMTNSEALLDTLNAWHNECDSSIRYCKDAIYCASNFYGHPDQLAYEIWLLDMIGRRGVPKFALCSSLYVYDALRIEAAIGRFGDDAVSEAQRIAEEGTIAPVRVSQN